MIETRRRLVGGRRRLTPTSATLLAVAIGFAGFYAGVRAEKSHATGSGSTRSVARGAAPTSSTSGVTVGTVSRVEGDTVYVKEPSGATVAVTLSRTTSIDKSQNVSGHSVRPGDTVSVVGTQGSGGAIKSTSISDSGNTSPATTSTTSSG